MARIDDYIKAVELGKKALEGKNPEQIAGFSGAGFEKDSEERPLLNLNFLGKEVAVNWPELGCSFKGSGEEVPIQQQVLLLHYLIGCKGAKITGEWIAYQEVPDGKFYLDAFLRRAKNPMLQAFGSQPELLVELAKKAYGATPFDRGDLSVLVQALPLVPVALILWKEDEEFPPEGNILFDKCIREILSAEDIAWLAGMIVYPLMGMARNH